MGGKDAQLAFHYQNFFSIFQILNALEKGGFISAKIEQKINGAGLEEIDLILDFTDGFSEYYEVKSGITFTNRGSEIKKTVLKFGHICNATT